MMRNVKKVAVSALALSTVSVGAVVSASESEAASYPCWGSVTRTTTQAGSVKYQASWNNCGKTTRRVKLYIDRAQDSKCFSLAPGKIATPVIYADQITFPGTATWRDC